MKKLLCFLLCASLILGFAPSNSGEIIQVDYLNTAVTNLDLTGIKAIHAIISQ